MLNAFSYYFGAADQTSAPASAVTAEAESRSAGANAAKVDKQERRVGLEDPDDPAFQDDPAIFATAPGSARPNDPTVAGQPFVDPRVYGGSSLDQSNGTLGEPLNVIVSGRSSPEILTRKGLQSYFRSLDFDFECFGLHSGALQKAWIDARGWQDELFLYRQVYSPLDHVFGTCLESLRGGNHCRVWQQAGTGAWFLAVSQEENVSKKHMIIPNGYNVGRDAFIAASQSKSNAESSWLGKRFRTRVEYVSGLMAAGVQGINHGIAVDGRTAVITVEVISKTAKTAKTPSASHAVADSTSSASKARDGRMPAKLQRLVQTSGAALRRKKRLPVALSA